jgi:hypothetical protein
MVAERAGFNVELAFAALRPSGTVAPSPRGNVSEATSTLMRQVATNGHLSTSPTPLPASKFRPFTSGRCENTSAPCRSRTVHISPGSAGGPLFGTDSSTRPSN